MRPPTSFQHALYPVPSTEPPTRSVRGKAGITLSHTGDDMSLDERAISAHLNQRPGLLHTYPGNVWRRMYLGTAVELPWEPGCPSLGCFIRQPAGYIWFSRAR